jgi:hypothetical protein
MSGTLASYQMLGGNRPLRTKKRIAAQEHFQRQPSVIELQRLTVKPISEEQLACGVDSIYASVNMTESKCINAVRIAAAVQGFSHKLAFIFGRA